MILTLYEQFQGVLKVGDYHKDYVHMTSNPEILEEMTKHDMKTLLRGNPEDASLVMDFVIGLDKKYNNTKFLESRL